MLTGDDGRRMAVRFVLGAAAAVLFAWPDSALSSDWVQFQNQTSTRLVAASSLGANDVDEKDYAWADLDQDGDIDLVNVRKQPFTSSGKRVNVLFMNEGGVLVDRTSLYAVQADLDGDGVVDAGDQGFNTPTNDRDVVIVDVDLDGWLDVVTATTISDNDPKHIGHPRIYMNLRDDAEGNWLGLLFDNVRIPQMLTYSGLNNKNPRFCSVAAGDLTGDGYPELWFGDYDSSGAGGSAELAGNDFNDKLLLNDGTGYFTDVSGVNGVGGAFSGTISIPGGGTPSFLVSAFGAAAGIADMNGDGVNDIIKQTSLNFPQYVGIGYNDPSNEGAFDDYEVVNNQAPYFVSIGDLNNDNKLDLVITDDGTDHYHLNLGNGADGRANFSNATFPVATDGFGSQSAIIDLNNDGWKDVIIADIDVDIDDCVRTTDILRNNGNAPNVTFTSDIGNISSSMLVGVFHSAPFDINGDGWLDLVLGRCSGTQVWMNLPPVGIDFAYPQGLLPEIIDPGQAYSLQVQLTPTGGTIDPSSVVLNYSINGGSVSTAAMTHLGGDVYEGSLSAAGCPDAVEYYVTAELTGGSLFRDPPTGAYASVAALGLEVVYEDHIEADVSGWTVVNDASLTSGAWEQADPNGSFSGVNASSPEDDATPGAGNVQAFVTENGLPGGASGTNDVDGGMTTLISPVIDLAGSDATISYARWISTLFATPDPLTVEVTNNGADWVLVESADAESGSWQTASFVVSAFVAPTATVQVRFSISDADVSVTEAGIDDFAVERYVCASVCPADLNGGGSVGAEDLALLLGAWGPNAGHPADLNGNGTVGAEDLALLLGAWGPCE